MLLEELDREPAEVRTGEYYRTFIVGNVSVAELDDHRIFYEEAEDIGDDFVDKLRSHPEVTATVDVVDMDRAVGDLLLDTVAEAARTGRDHGLEKYGIVSEDVTRYAMKNNVDIDGIETFVSDDPMEALEWALDE